MRASESLNSVLNELVKLVNSANHLEDIVQGFGSLVCSLIESDRITISVNDAKYHSTENLLIYGASFKGHEYGYSHSTAENPWSFSQSPYVLDEAVLRHSQRDKVIEKAAQDAGFRSTLVAPINWQKNTIAALTFRSKKSNAFGERQLQSAGLVADHIAGAIASHVSYRELRSELTKRELLAQISRVITSSPSLENNFEEVGELITDLIPSDRLSITIVAEPGEAPVAVFAIGTPLVGTDTTVLPPVRGEISQKLNQTRTPFIVDDLSPDTINDVIAIESLTQQAGLKSWMVAPLEWQQKLVGVIHFRSKQASAYTHLDLEIAGQLARQISGSVAGMLELKTQTALARERELLAEIGRITSSGSSLNEVFDRFAELVGELIPSDRTSVFIHSANNEQPSPALVHGVQLKSDTGDPFPIVTGDMSELLDEVKAPIIFKSGEKGVPKDVEMLNRLAEKSGLNSWLIAPMLSRDKLIGNLHFRSRDENAYGDRELRLAKEISDQISGTVASFTAFQQLEIEALTRDTLSEIAKIVSEAEDFVAVLPQVREIMKSVISFDGLTFNSYDAESDTITLTYQDGFADEATMIGQRYPSIESYFGGVARDQTRLAVTFDSPSDLKEFPRTANAFRAGSRSFASVPLISRQILIGSVQIRSDSPDAFGEDELEYLGRVADQLAGAFGSSLSNELVKLQAVALETAENAIVISDHNRIVEWVNPAFTKITGWTINEIIGKPTKVMRSTGPEQDAKNDEINEALANKVPWSGRQVNLRRDGSEYTESVVITPVLDNQGELIHVIAIKQDITDQIDADNARALQEEIEARNSELQKLADGRSEFLSTVSHELRTPLTIVAAFADILFNVKSENLSPEQINHITLIRKSSKQLAGLINDLIDVSQADAGRLFMRKEMFNLADLIGEVAENSTVVLGEFDQTIEVDDVDPNISLYADRARVLQILTNLIGNSSKYSKIGSSIELKVTQVDRHVKFEIKDYGQGISDNELPMVFSPFYRGDTAESGDNTGIGLGLSLVKGLVLQHEGDISIQSRIGEGTTVTVELPGATTNSAPARD